MYLEMGKGCTVQKGPGQENSALESNGKSASRRRKETSPEGKRSYAARSAARWGEFGSLVLVGCRFLETVCLAEGCGPAPVGLHAAAVVVDRLAKCGERRVRLP